MRLGIMQPYFFPYIGYFDLIANTDRWVVFDVVQYNHRSWMNRNRILHPRQSWQYVTVPVRYAPKGTPVTEIRLQTPAESCRRILGQLDHYRRRAPYFREAVALVGEAFARSGNDSLCSLNTAGLSVVCEYLGIPFRWQRCSELGLHLDGVEHPGQWALKISAQMGAATYTNPVGGKQLFVNSEWEEAGIRLEFMDVPDFAYNCAPYVFEPNLSIIDVIMWCSPDSVRSFLQEHKRTGISKCL
jgi:WbqC-like protein family